MGKASLNNEVLTARNKRSARAPSDTVEMVSQESFLTTIMLMVLIPLLCFGATLVYGEERTLYQYVPSAQAGTYGDLKLEGEASAALARSPNQCAHARPRSGAARRVRAEVIEALAQAQASAGPALRRPSALPATTDLPPSRVHAVPVRSSSAPHGFASARTRLSVTRCSTSTPTLGGRASPRGRATS